MPATTSTQETTTRAVNLRVRDDIRDLIDQAARSQGKSRSEFMIDAARRDAEDVLPDQTLVRVDQKTYTHFLKVLDQPPGEGYDRLMLDSWKSSRPHESRAFMPVITIIGTEST